MEKLTREAYLEKINFLKFENDTYKWKYHLALIKDTSLSGNEIRIMSNLVSLYNEEKGYSFPSLRTLMKMTGIRSINTVSACIKNLEDKGYLEIYKIKGRVNHYRPAYYDVKENEWNYKNKR